jgi:hypothetical protein
VVKYVQANTEAFHKWAEDKCVLEAYSDMKEGEETSRAVTMTGAALPVVMKTFPHMLDAADMKAFVKHWAENEHESVGKMMDVFLLGTASLMLTYAQEKTHEC